MYPEKLSLSFILIKEMKKNANAVSKSATKKATSVRVATSKKATPTKSAKLSTPATKAGSTEKPAKVAYTATFGKKAAAKTVLESKNIISCYYKKDDGTYRWIAGRNLSATPNNLGQIQFRDMVGQKEVTLNLNNILYIKQNKVVTKVNR